jgi:dipeptidyl aminopeptidase/acylaminoacyl peptidase
MDPELSRDGKKVLFRSNRDGVPELYVGDVAKPASPPRKLVAGPERVASAAFSTDGKYVLFRRDEGADENFRIYRIGVDGGPITELTPGEKLHRADILTVRNDPASFFYSAASPSSPASTLYKQAVAGGEPKAVYVDPAPTFGADVDPSGAHVLMIRIASLSEQTLLEVDVASGKARTVYPPEGKKAAISAAAYAADGKRIFVASDDGGETSALHALDAATLTPKAAYRVADPSTASIESVQVSRRGDRIAIVIDAGNHSEARILDARSLVLQRKVDAPLGAITGGPFADDGVHFTMVESTPEKPTDIYSVDATSGAVAPLRNDERRGLADLPPIATTIETVKAFDGLPIPVNVYLPKGAAASARRPVIAWFHGGPAGSSAVKWNYFARFYTSQNYAFVEPNIRGSTGFGRSYEMADNKEKRGDALKDVATVNAWIKAQPWADPERVVIFGGSYGGYLVLMALTRQTGLWRAGIDLVGVANLFTFLKSTDQTIRTVFVDEFGDLEKDRALLEQYSPYAQVDRISAPLFVYQGQNDPRVPREESDQIVASLRARRIPVEYMVMPNEGHSADRKESRIELLTRSTRFLADHMR